MIEKDIQKHLEKYPDAWGLERDCTAMYVDTNRRVEHNKKLIDLRRFLIQNDFIFEVGENFGSYLITILDVNEKNNRSKQEDVCLGDSQGDWIPEDTGDWTPEDTVDETLSYFKQPIPNVENKV